MLKPSAKLQKNRLYVMSRAFPPLFGFSFDNHKDIKKEIQDMGFVIF